MHSGVRKVAALAISVAFVAFLGFSGLRSLAQTGSPDDPIVFTEITDLRPSFRDMVFEFEGGAFDSQIGYVFAIRNLAGASVALDALPGSFSAPGNTPINPSAVLSAGTFYRAGLEVWQSAPELFEPIFDEGGEVLNASPDADRPENIIVVVPAGTPTVRYDLQGRRARGDLDDVTTVIKQVDLTPPSPLTADAGFDRTVGIGETTTVDASKSTNLSATPLTYSWRVEAAPAGSVAGLSDADALRPTFTPDVEGEYSLTLSITDGVETSTDLLLISTSDVAPVAILGEDQQIERGQAMFVNLSDSFDLDGTRLRNPDVFIVSKPLNSNTDYDPETQSFRPDVPGEYVVGLTVESGASGTSLVKSNVGTAIFNTGNVAPLADAGDDLPGIVGEVTRLNATASRDANGDQLTFFWSLLSQPSGSVATLTDATTAMPGLAIDADGNYVAQLITTDKAGAQSADTVVISTINTRPVARLGGDRPLTLDAALQLDASASNDPDGAPLTYFWTVSRRNNQAALSDRTAVNPVYTSRNGGRKVLQLVVSDGVLESKPAQFYAPVDEAQIPPTAVASVSGDTFAGASIALDGSASIDLNQNGLTYAWSLIHKPAGSTTEIVDPSDVQTTFTPDIEGIYVAQLIVQDSLRLRFLSRPATISVEVGEPPAVNVPPSFVSTPVISAQAGALYEYTAIANDPEGASIAYTLDTFPAGMIIDAATGFVTWTPNAAGTETVVIKATDSGGAFSTQGYEIEVAPGEIPNQAPVLTQIGDQVAELGQTLMIQLEATDVNGSDLVTFMAAPLPLIDGATLNAETGLFTFAPGPAQAGATLEFTFLATDGALSDSETITISVGEAGVPDATALSGRVLDAVAFSESGAEIPIVGAVVQILGAGTPVITGADGTFSVTGIPAGRQLIDIVASGATPAPDGTIYTNFREGLEITEGVDNIIDRPFFLSRIAPDSVVTVDPAQVTVLDSPSTGMRLVIEPNSVMDESGAPFTGQISLAMVPEGLTPAPLPEDLQAGVVFSVQPAGLRLTTPAQITMPNFFELDPGDQLQLWSLDPVLIEGILEVTPDGQSMVSVQGGLSTTTWKAPVGPDTDSPDEDPDNKDNEMCNCEETGSTTSSLTGALQIEHNLVPYNSVGRPRGLTFTYNSGTAAPRPLVSRRAALTVFRPEFQELTAQLNVGGVAIAQNQRVDVSGIQARQPFTNLFAQSFDASAFETGRYDFVFGIGSRLSSTQFGQTNATLRVTPLEGEILINNQSNSSFGTGWGLSDLSEIVPGTGEVLITRGDGSISAFEEIPAEISFSNRVIQIPRSFDGPDFNSDFGFIDFLRVPLQPARIVDVDGDNLSDIVGRAGEFLRFALQNRTTGEFDTIRTIEGFAEDGRGSILSFDFADFNEDGLGDIVILSPENFSINIGAGGGFFTGPEFQAEPNCDPDFDNCNRTLVSDVETRIQLPSTNARGAFSAIARDVDLDDHVDVVIFTQRELYLYYGNGDGTFAPVITLVTNTEPGRIFFSNPTVFVEDINNDGLPELIMQRGIDASDLNALIYLNQTGRTFSPIDVQARSGRAQNGRRDLESVADFDGDGNLDLIFTGRPRQPSNDFRDFLRILPGNGDGTFGGMIEILLDSTSALNIIDVNGDELPDLIFSSSSLDGRAIRFNNGNFELGASVLITPNIGLGLPIPGDINDDGVLDFVGFLNEPPTPEITDANFGQPILSRGPNGEFITSDFDGFQVAVSTNGDTLFSSQEFDVGPFDIGFDGEIFLPGINGFENITVFPNGDTQQFIPDPINDEDGTIIFLTQAENGNTIGPAGEVIFPDGRIVFFATAKVFFPETFRTAAEIGNTLGADGTIFRPFESNILPNGDQIFQDGSVLPFGQFPTLPIAPDFEYIIFEGNALIGDQAALYNSPHGDFSQLVRQGDGSFVRAFRGGRIIEYRPDGKQISDADANGNTTRFTYNSDRQLTSILDPVGLETRIEYSAGRIQSVIDPAGRMTSFTHANGMLTSITDPDGSQRTFEYQANGLLLAQTSKRGFDTRYVFDANNRHVRAVLPDGTQRDIESIESRLTQSLSISAGTATVAPINPSGVRSSFTNARGAITSRSVNAMGATVGMTDPLGRESRVIRDLNSNMVGSISPEGRATIISRNRFGSIVSSQQGIIQEGARASLTGNSRRSEFTYDPLSGIPTSLTQPRFQNEPLLRTVFVNDGAGNVLSTENPAGGTRQREFNAFGLLTTETDENGNTTTFSYDAFGNLSSIVNPLGIETRLERDAAGNIISMTDAFGTPSQRTATFSFDSLNRVLSSTDGDGAVTNFTYNAFGGLVTTEDATGFILQQEYDSRERLIATIDPRRGRTDIELDAEGNPVTITNDAGNIISMTYDLANQLVSSTDALGLVSSFEYDLDGNLTSVTNGRGAVTRLTYDPFGRTTSRIDPLGGITQYEYDGRDNLLQVTDAMGQIVTNQYDNLDRLTSITTPDNAINFSFDQVGNLLSANDNDTAMSYIYDEVDRLVNITTNGTMLPDATLDISYNARGLRTSLLDSFGGSQSYSYDMTDRLEELTTNIGSVISLEYDSAGRPTQVSFGDRVVSAFSYESGTGRLQRLSNTASGNELYTADYEYSSLGNITSIDETGEIGSKLRQFTYDDLQRLISGGSETAPESYSYDAVGNREITHLSAVHVVNNADRLLQDEQFTYQYDANGNLISQSETSTGLVTSYVWDAQDQLIGISKADGTTVAYAYDALGRRTAKVLGASSEMYFYDGEDIYLEVDGANSLQARYAHGDRIDSPLALERDGEEYFFLTDHQGSIRQLTDAAGLVVNQYSYDSYGQFIERVETVSQIYGYTAREQDAESPLYYYRSRYYDPRTGRFTQQDRIGFDGNDLNIYRYLSNNPLNDIDPNGEAGLLGAALGVALDLALQLGEGLACGQSLGEAFSNVDPLSVAISGASGFFGGVGGGAAARRLAARASNRTKGKIGEAFTRARLLRRGRRFAARPGTRAGNVPGIGTRLTGRGANSQPDFSVRNRDGSSSFVESKFNTSGLTPAQRDAARQLGDDFRVDRTTLEDVRRAGGTVGAGFGAGAGVAGNDLARGDDCRCQ